jgi:hypothetical protein
MPLGAVMMLAPVMAAAGGLAGLFSILSITMLEGGIAT